MDKSDFKKLKAKWDNKLAKSGFEELETKSGDLRNTTKSGGVIDKRRVTWEQQQEYYYLATHFLNDHEFKNKNEEIIWEYHSNGMSIRNIVETLNKVRKKKTDRQTVWEIVKALSNEMKTLYKVTK